MANLVQVQLRFFALVGGSPGAEGVLLNQDLAVRLASAEEATMAMYLTRFSYTPETWARMIEHPEDRRNAARSYIESVGGKLHGFWYGFGEHDGWNLWEAPDNVSMAAVALAIGSGGALSSAHTRPPFSSASRSLWKPSGRRSRYGIARREHRPPETVLLISRCVLDWTAFRDTSCSAGPVVEVGAGWYGP
jgi:uncharacterized protein with GYD domain